MHTRVHRTSDKCIHNEHARRVSRPLTRTTARLRVVRVSAKVVKELRANLHTERKRARERERTRAPGAASRPAEAARLKEAASTPDLLGASMKAFHMFFMDLMASLVFFGF